MGKCLSTPAAEFDSLDIHKTITYEERLMREWEISDRNGDGTLSLGEINAMLDRLNATIPNNVVKQKFRECDEDGSGALSFDEFKVLFESVHSCPAVLEELYEAHKTGDFLSADDLQAFLVAIQGADPASFNVRELINKYEIGAQDDSAESLSLSGFKALMTDLKFNSALRGGDAVHQDMSHPLAHYYLSSSHNTYLTGNQLTSDASAQAIIRAVRMGVRVVELDAWDGPNGQPIVLHGHTMTKPVSFRECVKAVGDHAFHASEYPAVITIENHCCPEQQAVQAQILREELGDKLYVPANPEAAEFLSPEELKGMVLVRDKPKGHGHKGASASSEAKAEGDDGGDSSSSDDDEEEGEGEGEGEAGAGASGARPSDLVSLMYIRNVKFKGFDPEPAHCSSSSLNEGKLAKVAANPQGLQKYSQTHLVRVYPAGGRVDSSNYDPQPAWNAGAQIVALNYQFASRPTWLNQGRFAANGGCGYLLKPEFMLQDPPTFDPAEPGPVRQTLTLTLISGHYLPKPEGASANSEVIDPYVEVEMTGVPADVREFKSTTIDDNGFNPQWDQQFTFEMTTPELASLVFVVSDKDLGGDDFIGQASVPVAGLAPGYRAVQLRRGDGVVIDNAYLFCRVELS